MNAQNAQSIGYEDAKRYFRLSIPETILPNEVLLESARNRAFYGYHAKALKTIDAYVKGYQDGIEAHEAEQAREVQAAAERAAIPHNPNTRFCSCVKCSQEGE